jgi:hypothetical protein
MYYTVLCINFGRHWQALAGTCAAGTGRPADSLFNVSKKFGCTFFLRPSPQGFVPFPGMVGYGATVWKPPPTHPPRITEHGAPEGPTHPPRIREHGGPGGSDLPPPN